MRERRAIGRRARSGAARPLALAAAAGQRLFAILMRRPVDTVAILGAATASLIIVVNALWLQSEPRPAPFLANLPAIPQSTANHAGAALAKPAEPAPAPARASLPQRGTQVASSRHADPIAELLGAAPDTSSARVMAVQRALSAYGYGQIRPSGIVDEPTSAAIEKFQGEHKMSVTGRVSDRLLSELAAMIGHPVE